MMIEHKHSGLSNLLSLELHCPLNFERSKVTVSNCHVKVLFHEKCDVIVSRFKEIISFIVSW